MVKRTLGNMTSCMSILQARQYFCNIVISESYWEACQKSKFWQMHTSLIKNLGNQKSWVSWECRRLDEDVDFTQRYWVYGEFTRKGTQPSGLDYGAGEDKALFCREPKLMVETSAYRYFRNSFSGQHWMLSPKLVLCTLLHEITASPACFQVV